MSSIEEFITQSPIIVQSSLSQLRYLILSDGLPAINNSKTQKIRCYVWSILSRTSMNGTTQNYLNLLQFGPPSNKIFKKITDDTFRTFPTDSDFTSQVPKDVLTRSLSCFAWQTEERNEIIKLDRPTDKGTHLLDANSDPTLSKIEISTYVQGMNVLMATTLYACPTEPMAFQIFSTLCYSMIPTYVTTNMIGARNGVKLLDLCLKIIDPKLSNFLSRQLLTAEIYGLPSILTFSSCNKPLIQAVKLWDFMFAYGFHMNILLVVAMLVSIRKQILESSNPMNLITRNLPAFNADELISLGVGFIAKIPIEIYDLLVNHLTDPDIKIPSTFELT
ncbi:hypothetical protein NCAS_0A08220 [Naumovozyma castellii]|uniref:Rab-GAP TBC domain-containing protein n=1 Tax=Naumovozyma castellii TaxID=27288 RepID=G0V7D2_NAUCA|nr:hypothetical protein NCAS_0A08220 [Naumovozyma castellii CBS 4309]CCC67380.1 hypothetical protein NCAS_0A08220 [Naumovozyma castellii CBS 4309]